MKKTTWQEWVSELRQERKESPFETFFLLLLLLFLCVLIVSVAALMLYHFTIPIIVIGLVLFGLWQAYQRI